MHLPVASLAFSAGAATRDPQRVLAEEMTATPQFYEPLQCGSNVQRLLQHLYLTGKMSREELARTNVAVVVDKKVNSYGEYVKANFETGALECLFPNNNLEGRTGDGWSYHAFIERDGRVFDYDDVEAPGRDLASYAMRMFDAEDAINSDVWLISALSFLCQPDLSAPEFIGSPAARRQRFARFVMKSRLRWGRQVSFADLPPRLAVHRDWEKRKKIPGHAEVPSPRLHREEKARLAMLAAELAAAKGSDGNVKRDAAPGMFVSLARWAESLYAALMSHPGNTNTAG